ncbi:hypothetical protein ZIOFF_008977 [Zingiber officinale]|uniref:Subtilisin-like protease fibronectin type-III domain-containing protein n=1 Tax=Zingiber officinale TaxID=94328 RepID=A0A8J5HMB6_ZINOF|nr:hypothetical protein ZIOFF_008977 [Zingiber officinale]
MWQKAPQWQAMEAPQCSDIGDTLSGQRCLSSAEAPQADLRSLGVDEDRSRAVAKVTRTVTNVGLAKSSYTVSVSISKTVVSTTVTPKMLTFNELNEQKSFTVSAKWGADGPPTSGNNQFVEGKLTWTSDDGKHVVTSPFIVSAY